MAITGPRVAARAAHAGMLAATGAARLVSEGAARTHRSHPPPPATGPLRVLMVAMYPRSFTGTKYRLDLWARRLREHGHEVELALTMADDHAQRLAHDWSVRARAEFHLRMLRSRLATVNGAGRFHVAVIHMNDLPYWDLGPPFVAQALKRLSGRLLLDLDDLPVVGASSELAPKALALGRVVDGLIVGNRSLAAEYPGRPSWWVPTCVEPSEWTVPDRVARSGAPVLGWVGTAGNLDNLEALGPVLADACARHGARLRVVCSRPADLPGVPQDFVKWTAAGEQSDLEPFDVGLAPLHDGPMQRAKCGLKALQYMASGLPVVASPVGALGEIVSHGTTGFLAATPEEWAAALDRLLADAELRGRLGAAGRQAVEERWSFARHQSTFEAALRGLPATGEDATGGR